MSKVNIMLLLLHIWCIWYTKHHPSTFYKGSKKNSKVTMVTPVVLWCFWKWFHGNAMFLYFFIFFNHILIMVIIQWHDKYQRTLVFNSITVPQYILCHVSSRSPWFCQVRHGPESTFLSQNVVLTQSLNLTLTLPITFT